MGFFKDSFSSLLSIKILSDAWAADLLLESKKWIRVKTESLNPFRDSGLLERRRSQKRRRDSFGTLSIQWNLKKNRNGLFFRFQPTFKVSRAVKIYFSWCFAQNKKIKTWNIVMNQANGTSEQHKYQAYYGFEHIEFSAEQII